MLSRYHPHGMTSANGLFMQTRRTYSLALACVSVHSSRAIRRRCIALRSTRIHRSAGATEGRHSDLRSLRPRFIKGVLCQFAVCSPSGDLQGLVVSYQADLTNGHAYFGYLRATSVQPIPGATTEGLALFFRHLFKCFPLRMLYCELPSSNIHLIRSLTDAGLFQQVGRFPEHLFGPHGFEDMYTFILTRETWQTYFSGYFPDSRPPDIER